MNKQKKGGGIEWTHIYGLDGLTANPVRGCLHACAWEMPDGSIAQCYAKSMAERIQKSSQVTGRGAYLQGFEHLTYHPKELQALQRRQKGAGVFIDSMSDLLGHSVQPLWILESLQTMATTPQHIYFLLSKNPPAYGKYGQFMPPNVFAGISAPPQYMFGNRLDEAKQARWFEKGLNELAKVPVPVRWVSIEPLSWGGKQAETMIKILLAYASELQFAVIGAASNKGVTYQPDKAVLQETLAALNHYSVPVFFKGNLSRELVASIGSNWREEYPAQEYALDPAHWQTWHDSPAPARLAQALAQAKEINNESYP